MGQGLVRCVAAAGVAFVAGAGCFNCLPSGAVCGNGLCEPGEDPACGIDCSGRFCGDGVCDPIEDPQDCPVDCAQGVCGDGVLGAGEECDPPDGVTCDGACRLIPGFCGNFIVEPGEECDPPDGVSCDGACRVVTGPPANPGEPCASAADCFLGGYTDLVAFCFTEDGFGFPGGFCALQGCETDGSIPCPSGTVCLRPSGFATYCLPECVPGPSGNGGCRTDISATGAYQCQPGLLDPDAGGCWLGCSADEGCNPCAGGFCQREPSVACLTEADCTALPTAWRCQLEVSGCHPEHAPGSSPIGGSCTTDLDCPAYAQCVSGAGDWPGGYCTQLFCETWGALPEFACPTGAVCPSVEGFFGGLLQLCAAACTVDPADPTAQCDAFRGDDNDYMCMENVAPAVALSDLCDTAGAPGFCVQWSALFGTDPSCP